MNTNDGKGTMFRCFKNVDMIVIYVAIRRNKMLLTKSQTFRLLIIIYIYRYRYRLIYIVMWYSKKWLTKVKRCLLTENVSMGRKVPIGQKGVY